MNKIISLMIYLLITLSSFGQNLITELDSILKSDQVDRMQLDDIAKKYGWESKEMLAHWKIIENNDSVNLKKVKIILDENGWLGADIIGEDGNLTLFLVIQHADQATQEKYLPMMREAVKNGNASNSDLALLEDRVSLRQGKKQTYGSQVGRDPDTKLYYVRPLEDPDNVDIRRNEVGLEPLAAYLIYWQIVWDAQKYKKELPAIEILEKLQKQ